MPAPAPADRQFAAVASEKRAKPPLYVSGDARSGRLVMPASNRDIDLPSLDALRVFEVTARRLNFSKAAEELHVTQSAISHRIRELERQLHTRLFQRGHRSLQLTPAGRTLADGIQRGLGEIRNALMKLDSR